MFSPLLEPLTEVRPLQKKGSNQANANGEYSRYRVFHRYAEWKRVQLTNATAEPMANLLKRSAYLSLCVLVDGVILPWIILILNRSFISGLVFACLLIVAVALEYLVYGRLNLGSKDVPDLKSQRY